MARTGIDARLAKRQLEFFFEKPDLRARAPGAKDLARHQGRRSGAGTVPDQAPAASEILVRETGIMEKAIGSRALTPTAEKPRGFGFPTRRGRQYAVAPISLAS